MELEEGMYVRTKQGIIDKIMHIAGLNSYGTYYRLVNQTKISFENGLVYKSDILKASHNIIDLIQEGDILKINDYKDTYTICEVEKFKNPYFPLEKFLGVRHNNKTKRLYEIPLINLKIVTKEQFESISYKVGGSNE